MRDYLRSSMLSIVVLLSYAALALGTAQYCHYENPQTPFTFCAAVNTLDSDWAITFGYKRTRDAGWGALGIGSGMYGALMFLTYTKEKAHEDLVLSVRHGVGYSEPLQASTLPSVETISTTLNQTEWFEINFVCHGCGDWSSVENNDDLQSWIWAANVNQVFEEVSPDSTLQKHGYYGYFQLDMSMAKSDEKDGDAKSPAIRFDKSNAETGSSDGDDGYGAPAGGGGGLFSSNLFAVHGFCVAFATMILFPCGLMVIRGTSAMAFRNHVYIQLAGSALLIAGSSLALYGTFSRKQTTMLSSPHALLGLLVVFSVPLQAILGYVHHKAYVIGAPNRKVTTSHVWIGRLIIVGGCLNTMLGLRMAGAATLVSIFAGTLAVINVVLTAVMASFKEPKKTLRSKEEEDVTHPFLELDQQDGNREER